MAEDVLFEFLHMEIVNLMYDCSAANDEQVMNALNMAGQSPEAAVEMFNVDTVEDSSSVRSYPKFLIANFCYKYIHTITLKKHRQLQQQSESNYH